MKQGTFFAKALGIAIAIPVSGLIALGGAGIASAVTCPTGTVPVMSNGVSGCTPTGTEGDGTVTPVSGDSPSGKPVMPVRTSPPDEPSPTQPLTPMTPTPNPSAPAPVIVVPAPITSAIPVPPPTSIEPTSGSATSEAGIAVPAETIAPATSAGGVPTMAPRETAVQGTGSSTGNAAGNGQDLYPPALNEIKVEEIAPASDAEPFNPAGILIAGLTGILAALVGLLFWVNKKHAAKKQPVK